MLVVFPYEIFELIPSGTIFATGKILNNPKGFYATTDRIDDELRWVAKKGYADDWCIYIFWAVESSVESVAEFGDKVYGEENIRKMINADDEMLARYRH